MRRKRKCLVWAIPAVAAVSCFPVAFGDPPMPEEARRIMKRDDHELVCDHTGVSAV